MLVQEDFVVWPITMSPAMYGSVELHVTKMGRAILGSELIGTAVRLAHAVPERNGDRSICTAYSGVTWFPHHLRLVDTVD